MKHAIPGIFRSTASLVLALGVAAAALAQELADGEVRRVDRDAKKITLRHGPIASIDMPPMTMVFQVKDPAMLGGLKPGDKVKFSAEKIDGAYVVTRIEAGVQ